MTEAQISKEMESEGAFLFDCSMCQLDQFNEFAHSVPIELD